MNIQLLQTGILKVNTYIVPISNNSDEKRVFIIDPASSDFSSDNNIITDFITYNNLKPFAILLTHGHFDHIMAIEYLKSVYKDILIFIHKDDADCIGQNSQIMQKKVLDSLGPFGKQILEYVSNLPEPDNLLQDNISLDKVIPQNFSIDLSTQNALSNWKVIHTPGHTKGSVCFYNQKEKVLLSGDTLFFGTYGRTDLIGGSETQIKQSLKKIYQTVLPDTFVYPGHDTYGFMLKGNMD